MQFSSQSAQSDSPADPPTPVQPEHINYFHLIEDFSIFLVILGAAYLIWTKIRQHQQSDSQSSTEPLIPLENFETGSESSESFSNYSSSRSRHSLKPTSKDSTHTSPDKPEERGMLQQVEMSTVQKAQVRRARRRSRGGWIRRVLCSGRDRV